MDSARKDWVERDSEVEWGDVSVDAVRSALSQMAAKVLDAAESQGLFDDGWESGLVTNKVRGVG